MTYNELKNLSIKEAIKKIAVLPDGYEITSRDEAAFPSYPDVIVFGGHYWKSYETLSEFIDEYVQPTSEQDIASFLREIAYRIATDPGLSTPEIRKNKNIDYSIIFDQYNKIVRYSPTKLNDWSETVSIYLWFEFVLLKRRGDRFKTIIKDYDSEKFHAISAKVKKIYGFSDLEMIYLQYFCSQSKLDDLDPSLNTLLYLWSKEKMTGKTTVASYICGFLNGEDGKDVSAHKSNLSREMQLGRFDIPVAITSRCVMLDEAGFFDMTKTYDKFKSMVTSNNCEVEYKYMSAHRPKRCYRNYIITANPDPATFVKDEDERRILSVHFSRPQQVTFEELEKIWHEFVLECNLSKLKLEAIYHEIILPNSQDGDIKYIMTELKDILSKQRIDAIGTTGYFSVSNVMAFPEIVVQKIPRSVVKEVITRMYGEPDKSQRYYKIKREINGEVDLSTGTIDLPF